MRRRKSPRVIWLPSTNANSIDGNHQPKTSNWQQFNLDIINPAVRGDFAAGEISLVIDDIQEPSTATTSLSDLYNSGYRLRRIVGNIFVAMNQVANDTVKVVCVSAGLIVRQVNPRTDNSIALETGVPESISTCEIDNISDPWIWRRSWVLTNALSSGPVPLASAFHTQGQTRNYGAQAGCVATSSHVDQKTARIVGPEHRLVLDVTMQALSDGGATEGAAASIGVLTDLRVLGSLRTSTGNRRNASR